MKILIIKYKLNLVFFLVAIILPVFLFTASVQGERSIKDSEIIIKTNDSDEIYKIKLNHNIDTKEVISDILQRDDVLHAEMNVSFSMAAFPNDPFVGRQWYLDSIKVRDAWSQDLIVRESRKFTKESVIAVLDTGVDIKHPDLKENIWVNPLEILGDGIDNDKNGYIDDINGWDFVLSVKDPSPKFDGNYNKTAVNHGTVIAGIAAASGHNAEGISGISWHAKIMPLRVLDSQGNGNIYSVYKAIQYAIEKKVDIINMSFVGSDNSQLLSDIIREAYDAGIVVVAAAGNSDPSADGVDFQKEKRFPVCSASDEEKNYIIGVASLDKFDKRSEFSNYGDNCVDISAPGEEIFGVQVYNNSKIDFSQYYNGPWSGTSLSAPMVSGALALIKSVRPDLTNQQLIDSITRGSSRIEPSINIGTGKGKLNVNDSLATAMKYTSGEIPGESKEENFLVVTLGFESFPQLKVIKQDGSIFKSFYPFSPTFKGAINVAVANIDNDTSEEIVTSAGVGGGPHVRIFDIEGRLEGQFFAYDKTKRHGANIAVGDMDGDGVFEIITGPGKGGRPEVKIFTKDGTLVSSFIAYNEKFLGGVNVATGDIDGDGKDEIITGPGFGGGPHIRIFDKNGVVLRQFFAFNAESRGGARVIAGDLNGDIFDEIVTTVEAKAGPVVRVYRTTDFNIISEFLAFAPNYFNGLFLAVGDIDRDKTNEIIAGAGVGSPALLKVFDLKGNMKNQYNAHIDSYKGGARPAIMTYKY